MIDLLHHIFSDNFLRFEYRNYCKARVQDFIIGYGLQAVSEMLFVHSKNILAMFA